MHIIIGLEDWYTPPHIDLEVGRRVEVARATLAERYPDVRLYEFLPVATLQVDDLRELDRVVGIAGVTFAMEATSAMDVPGAARYYDRMLSALSAIRSESGYQRYAWTSAASEDAKFPHDGWVGGIWPSGPYPSLDRSGWLLREDRGLSRWASPAQISVLSLSIAPPGRLPSELNDPVRFAIASVSRSHVIVVAAGNQGPGHGTMNAWAADSDVLAVGALDGDGRLWEGSSRGAPNAAGPDVVADGVVPGDIGTSYAAPRVALLAMFCVAVISELNAALQQAQDRILGVPLEALAVIDVSPQTLEVELGGTWPRVGIPALPMVALHRNLTVAAFRAVLPSFLAAHGGKGLVDLPIAPQRITDVIAAAARPVPGAEPWEAGAGAVDADGVIEHFASATIADVIRWLGFDPAALGSARDKPAFERDGLARLLELVRLSRPVYAWDVRHGRFVLGSELRPHTGDLGDLRDLVSTHDTAPDGHIHRILSAILY